MSPWSAPHTSFRPQPFLLHRHVLSGMVSPPLDQGPTGIYYQLALPNGNIGIGGSFDLEGVTTWKKEHRPDADPPVTIDVVAPDNSTSIMNGSIVLLLTTTKGRWFIQSSLLWYRVGIITAVIGQLIYLALLAREPRQTSLFLNFCDPYPARPRRWTRQMVLVTQLVSVVAPWLDATYGAIFSATHLCLSFLLVVSTMLFCLDDVWDLWSIACLVIAWYCVDKDDDLRARHLVVFHR